MEAQHFRIVIIGGGTAGIIAAARIRRDDPLVSIALIEPNDTHYYQPAWTLVGANIYKFEDTARPMKSIMPKNVMWIQDSVKTFQPKKDQVTTKKGNAYTYSYLVICPGIKIDFNLVEGLHEAMEKGVACSNYTDPRYTWEVLKKFKGGTALFTQPTTYIKCGGAPQQIMYLAEDYFRKSQVRNKSTIILATPGSMLFSVKEIEKTMERVVKRKDIGVYFGYELVAVDAVDKIAWYTIAECEDYRNKKSNIKLLQDGNRRGIRFDMLHLAPPQSAPKFIRESPLAASEGWLPVDRETLQHVKYKNIFGIGDIVQLPTAKTVAAIRKQVPVVSFNIQKLMMGETLGERKYKGYSACMMVTGYKKMAFAEFNYKNQFTPSPILKFMLIFNSHREHWRLWILTKYIVPYLYWNRWLKGTNL